MLSSTFPHYSLLCANKIEEDFPVLSSFLSNATTCFSRHDGRRKAEIIQCVKYGEQDGIENKKRIMLETIVERSLAKAIFQPVFKQRIKEKKDEWLKNEHVDKIFISSYVFEKIKEDKIMDKKKNDAALHNACLNVSLNSFYNYYKNNFVSIVKTKHSENAEKKKNIFKCADFDETGLIKNKMWIEPMCLSILANNTNLTLNCEAFFKANLGLTVIQTNLNNLLNKKNVIKEEKYKIGEADFSAVVVNKQNADNNFADVYKRRIFMFLPSHEANIRSDLKEEINYEKIINPLDEMKEKTDEQANMKEDDKENDSNVVIFGDMQLDLLSLPPLVCKDVLKAEIPFGRILENHKVERKVFVENVWRVFIPKCFFFHFSSMKKKKEINKKKEVLDEDEEWLCTCGRTVLMEINGKVSVKVLEILNESQFELVN